MMGKEGADLEDRSQMSGQGLVRLPHRLAQESRNLGVGPIPPPRGSRGDIGWGEAGEQGIEGLRVGLIDPLVDGVGARSEHNEEGAEDIFRGIGWTALIGVEGLDDGAERGEIEELECLEEPIVMRGDRAGLW